MKYNYIESMKDDIKFWLTDNHCDWSNYGEDKEEIIEKLSEELWSEDAITGNGGDWYDSADICAHYLADNLDLVRETVYNLGISAADLVNYGVETIPQYIDCLVRCDLLQIAIEDLWDEEHKVEE